MMGVMRCAIIRLALTFWLGIIFMTAVLIRAEQQVSSTKNELTSSSSLCPCCTQDCSYSHGVLNCQNSTEWPLSSDYPCPELIERLDILNGRFQDIKVDLLNLVLPALRVLTIRHSQLELLRMVPVPEQLVQLDLSHNHHLMVIDWTFIEKATNLTHLNLGHNTLSSIEPLSKKVLPNLLYLDLSGNDWDCLVDFQWALELHEAGILVYGDNLTCQDESKKHDSWFQWSYSVIKREINKRIVTAECRERTSVCRCDFSSEGKEGRGSYSVQVDCSYRDLTSLPANLPSFTKELDVTGNSLTNLDAVANYKGQQLKILIADSNQIHSIRNLSGSVFLQNFSRFSLQHNFISPQEIPLNEIALVPDEFQIKYLYLYNNSWECDCYMATEVRSWLWKYRHIVNDSSLILCSRYGKKIPVLHLLPNGICSDWEDGNSKAAAEQYRIYMFHALIAVEIIVILAIGIKFAYDSWRFFRHGELPWIARKFF